MGAAGTCVIEKPFGHQFAGVDHSRATTAVLYPCPEGGGGSPGVLRHSGRVPLPLCSRIVGSWQSREGQGPASSAGPQSVEGAALNSAVPSGRVSVGNNSVWFLGSLFLV